jgi:O-antigen/teichoic acid export membrane protein
MSLKFWRLPLVGNALSLYGAQGLNYLVPLLLVPYLLRTLGPHSYGSIVFAQALMGYAVVLTEYGFNLTAARDISVARDDAAAVARIFWTTMAAKLFLLMVSFAAITAVVLLVPALRQSWPVVACSAVMVVGGIAFPQWYFQGLERLRDAALIQVLARIVTAAAIIGCVHSPADLLTAAFLMSASQLIGVIAAICLRRPVAPARFVLPRVIDVKSALAAGWHMFLSGASVALYGHTNTFVLGLICGEQAVALYNVAYKLVYALQSLATPIIQAVYPRASRLFDQDPRQAWNLVTRVARLLMPAIVGVSILAAVFAPQIVDIVGGRAYAEAVPAMRLLCMVPASVTAALLLAQCIMVNLGLTRQLSRIYIAVGLANLAILPGLVWQFGVSGAAASLVLAELLGPILMARSIAKNRYVAYQVAVR